jgi:Glycosyl transferase family 11
VRVKIVLRESGGLGNQLFQYAALRYYAKLYGAQMHIAVDPAWNALSYGSPRPCLLHHFSIPAEMEERSHLDRIMLSRKPGLQTVSALMKYLLRVQKISEKTSDCYSFVRTLPVKPGTRVLYLEGYFENHLLIEEIAGELRLDLAFRNAAEGKTLEVMHQILQSRTPVSVHVRRGDATVPAEGKVILPKEYYARAIAQVREKFGDATLFVFSDDISFAKENLGLQAKTVFVDHNDDYMAHEDLRLMSSCHHHIIANSTFSWWGAWLNPRLDKMVIAPRRWYLSKDDYYPDLFPGDWILDDFIPLETYA